MHCSRTRIFAPLTVSRWQQCGQGGRYHIPNAGAVCRLWQNITKESTLKLSEAGPATAVLQFDRSFGTERDQDLLNDEEN